MITEIPGQHFDGEVLKYDVPVALLYLEGYCRKCKGKEKAS